LSLYRFEAVFVEPLLRERQAIPVDERCRQGDLLPLGMKGRVLQSREFREEGIHKQSKLAIAFSVECPIVLGDWQPVFKAISVI
jgi:hypothetical protein